MRRIAPFVLLLSAVCWAQSNAGEFPINVHVRHPNRVPKKEN